MKKSFSFIAVVILLCSTILGLCACNDATIPSTPTVEKEKTGYSLVVEGVSEYRIVIPTEVKQYEYEAATELQNTMYKATGAYIAIVYESNVTINESTPVICIGDTEYAKNKGFVTDGTLDRSGYIMKTVGNKLFINSDGDKRGCVYAVYDFLQDAVGYRYYYVDEIYYDTTSNVPLYKYDDKVIPTFDFRTTWYPKMIDDSSYRLHLRYNHFTEEHGLKAHTQTWAIVNYTTQKAKHAYGATKVDPTTGETVPDHWFSDQGNQQLCWTAGEEMELQAAKDLYGYIVSAPDKIYFQMGQADNAGYCMCDRCKAALEEWGYNNTGLQINWANNVCKYVFEWLERDYPERKDVRIVLFAYMDTETPPMVDDGTGNFVPYSDKVIPNEHLYFEMAPITTDYSVTLEHANNADVLQNLQNWHKLLNDNKRLSIWTYETNFSYYLYPFNNFEVFQPQMKTYAQNGVTNMFSQGASLCNQPTFQEMRLFVESQIMWDVDRSYAELADEFLHAFYKDAYEQINGYYNLIRVVYEQAALIKGMNFSSIYSNIGSKDIWTEGVVQQIDNLFNQAYKSIEHYKTEDRAMYTKLYDRIKELEVTNIYTKLANYRTLYSQSEINQMVDDFNYYTSKYGITLIQESSGASAVNTYGMFDDYKQ